MVARGGLRVVGAVAYRAIANHDRMVKEHHADNGPACDPNLWPFGCPGNIGMIPVSRDDHMQAILAVIRSCMRDMSMRGVAFVRSGLVGRHIVGILMPVIGILVMLDEEVP